MQGKHQSQSGSSEEEKIFCRAGYRTSVIQPVATEFIIIIWFVMLLALRPLLAYCASLG
jgi:hypothetical protein